MDEKYSLPNNVSDAMRDNLPAQVSKILREELEKGAEAFVTVETLKETVDKLRSDISTHDSLTFRKSNLDKTEADLLEQKAELAALCETQASRDLKVLLEAEKRVSLKLEGALAGLVRNTAWRESVLNFDLEVDTSYTESGLCNTTERKNPQETVREAE